MSTHLFCCLKATSCHEFQGQQKDSPKTELLDRNQHTQLKRFVISLAALMIAFKATEKVLTHEQPIRDQNLTFFSMAYASSIVLLGIVITDILSECFIDKL